MQASSLLFTGVTGNSITIPAVMVAAISAVSLMMPSLRHYIPVHCMLVQLFPNDCSLRWPTVLGIRRGCFAVLPI